MLQYYLNKVILYNEDTMEHFSGYFTLNQMNVLTVKISSLVTIKNPMTENPIGDAVNLDRNRVS